MSIGLNVLAQYVSDRARIQQTTASAGVAVIMDDAAYARSLAAANPSALIVHRTYSPNDPNWHDRRADGSWVFPPADWIRDHAGTVGGGVVLQVGNEPHPVNVDKFLEWLKELVSVCPPSITLALCGFAVGTPHERDIESGVYDRLLRLLAGSRHYLNLHEYFKDDPAAEYPWLCGRFEYWLDRADTLGIERPKIFIGENGRDEAGGINHGWRGVGLTDERYAALLTDTHRRLYAPHGIRCAVFCYGTGGDNRWQSFNVENSGVLDAIEGYNMTQPTDKRTAIINLDRGVNLRASASLSGSILTKVPFGAEIDVWPQTVSHSDGFEWVKAQWGANVGYIVRVYEGADTYTVIAPPPDVPTLPDESALCSPFLTDEEHQQMITAITRMETASGELRAAFGELRQLWTLALERKQGF